MASTCTICSKLFSKHCNLRVHVKKFHPENLDEIAPYKKYEYAVAATCNECEKSFTKYSNLTKHVRRFHPDKEKEYTRRKSYAYECEECHKHFNDLNNFRSHKKIHENVESRKLYKCTLCSTDVNLTKAEMWIHFKTVHDIVLNSNTLKFSNQDEFYTWKGQVERDTQSYFINEHGSYNTNSYTKLKYVCHRSGIFKSKSKEIRRLKAQGSHKINGYCPAEISVKILNDGICEVEFVSQHIGHNNNLGHLNLSKTAREDLAAKISLDIPFDTILNEVRDSISGDQLERLHLLTKKDLSNIRQCFNLKNESVRHVKDSISVEAWIEEVEFTDNEALEIHENGKNSEEEKLIEAVIQDKQEEDLETLEDKKHKLRAELNSIINSITCNEQLEAFKKLMDPARSTLASIKNQS